VPQEIKDIIFPLSKRNDKNVLPTAVFIEFDAYTDNSY
jgi:hypothetical protein